MGTPGSVRYELEAPLLARAKSPHELFMVNLTLFHLLLTPAAIALDIGLYALLLPLALSSAVIAYTARRARRDGEVWFVQMHWRLAARRCRILLIGYALTAALLLLGYLLSLGAAQQNMQAILLTAFTRISIMPTLIAVMISIVLESSALGQAGRGELPEAFVRRYPPPGAE